MNTLVVIVEKDKRKEGCVVIKKEDLQNALREAYNEGYLDGQNSISSNDPILNPNVGWETPSQERWDVTEWQCMSDDEEVEDDGTERFGKDSQDNF